MKVYNLWQIVRDFLFSTANKEFLIFLFFLSLSGIFWLALTLDEAYEKEISIPIHLTGVPKDIVLTSDETDTLHVTIRDKGVTIFAYLYGDALHDIAANFKSYDQSNGTCIVGTNELSRLATAQLSNSSKIISIKPERLKFYYNTGDSKRVPVHWSGRVIPEHLYFISDVSYSPDSVTIYSSPNKLDSINVVYTEPLNYAGFRDTLSVSCQLKKIEGVKVVPDRIQVGFYTDVLTDESIDDIPVVGINMPEGKVLRTFPSKVSVKFVTGVSVFKGIKTSDFLVTADYNDIKGHPSEKCNLTLKKVPAGISRVTLVTNQVDYLIEEQAQ